MDTIEKLQKRISATKAMHAEIGGRYECEYENHIVIMQALIELLEHKNELKEELFGIGSV